LAFDRAKAWGMHLDIPAGDSLRWRPGEWRRVRLVAFGGRCTLQGFNNLTDGPAPPERLAARLGRGSLAGHAHRPLPGGAAAAGGGGVRLGGRGVVGVVERDETSYGDEVLRGWAKTMRTGLMMSDRTPAASELDLLITNLIVIDPVLGVLKANIGVKDGR